MFRARPALGQPEVHIHEVPRSVKADVDEPTLGLKALENFPRGVGSLAISITSEVLGININLVQWRHTNRKLNDPGSAVPRGLVALMLSKVTSRASGGIQNTGRRELLTVFLINSHLPVK